MVGLIGGNASAQYFGGKTEGERALGRPKHRWEVNV
jgi:hypothetical protein